MAYVCYDCKLQYGHPLIWCPGCGRKMQKIDNKTIPATKLLRDDGWKMEGDKDLYEYYLDGKLLVQEDKNIGFTVISVSPYKSLVDQVKLLYPEIWALFNIAPNYNPKTDMSPKEIGWQHGERSLKIYLKNERMTVYFHKPEVIFRLKGSTLPIDSVGGYEEKPFWKIYLS